MQIIHKWLMLTHHFCGQIGIVQVGVWLQVLREAKRPDLVEELMTVLHVDSLLMYIELPWRFKCLLI